MTFSRPITRNQDFSISIKSSDGETPKVLFYIYTHRWNFWLALHNNMIQTVTSLIQFQPKVLHTLGGESSLESSLSEIWPSWQTLLYLFLPWAAPLCILCEKRRSYRDRIAMTVIVNSILKAGIWFYYVKELPPTNSCQRKCLQMRKLNKAEIPRNNAPNNTQHRASNKFSRV